MTTRRQSLAYAALVPLAACATTPGTPTLQSGIARAVAIAQGTLNYVAPVVPLLAAFVPGAAPFVAPVMAGIQLADGLIGTLQQTTAAADAQTGVAKVSTAITGVLDGADQAAALIPNPTQRAQAQAILTAARGELALLGPLAANIVAVVNAPLPAAARVPMRGVVVPPILVRSAP